MANRFMDSFDHYITPDYKYNDYANVTIDSTSGRYGTAGANMNTDGVSFLRLDLDEQPGWIVGLAYNRNAVPDGSDLIGIYTDSSGSARQAGLAVLPSGAFTVTSSGSTVLTTSKVTGSNSWYYVEWRVYIGSPGSTSVYVNGNLWGSATGILQTSGSVASTIFIGGAGKPYIDDVYINDTAGVINNTVWGDTRIEATYPRLDGFNDQWDLSSGSAGWEIVSNNPPDLGEYISTGSLNFKSDFYMANISSGTGTIKSVQQLRLAAKNDITTRENRNRLVPIAFGAEYTGVTDTMTDSPNYYRTIWETVPGGGAWDESSLSTAQFGVESIS